MAFAEPYGLPVAVFWLIPHAMIGRKIAHYEILEKLGEGGMGEVYKARDTRLNRLAAIKVLPPDKMADPDRRARFIHEAQAASALNHPHIVTIYGIDRDAGVDFIAMEYAPGRSLDQCIGRRGLKLRETLQYAIQIADALAAAHAAGIVHRDLKPGNVMVSESGQVKVLDFGLAKLVDAVPSAPDATRTIRADEPLTEKGRILAPFPRWSPDGNTLYFLSTAGGKTEIWAQRLQPASKRPAGEPFRIYTPPGEKSIRTGTWFGPAIGPRSLIFPVSESTGNIWLAE